MATKDDSIDSFEQLFDQIKRYLKLQKEYTLIKLTEKLAILFSTLALVIFFLIAGMIALFYLLLAIAYAIEPYVGGLKWSFAIVAGADILIIFLIAIFRKKLIIKPTVNFLAHLFLEEEKKHE